MPNGTFFHRVRMALKESAGHLEAEVGGERDRPAAINLFAKRLKGARRGAELAARTAGVSPFGRQAHEIEARSRRFEHGTNPLEAVQGVLTRAPRCARPARSTRPSPTSIW